MKKEFSLDENWSHSGCDDHGLVFRYKTGFGLQGSIGEVDCLFHAIRDKQETRNLGESANISRNSTVWRLVIQTEFACSPECIHPIACPAKPFLSAPFPLCLPYSTVLSHINQDITLKLHVNFTLRFLSIKLLGKCFPVYKKNMSNLELALCLYQVSN